jgi:hypothetical protein
MPSSSLVRSLFTYRALFPTTIAISLGVITSWAALTGYTAGKSKQHSPVSQSTVDSSKPTTAQPKLSKDYGKLPLSFELNRGQVDSRVKYFAHGPGYNIFLTPTETTLVFQPPADKATGPKRNAADLDGRRHLELLDQNEAAETKLTAVTMRLAVAWI